MRNKVSRETVSQRPPCVKGERSERCQWQMKRGERVAAVKILAAQIPQQNFGHRSRSCRAKRDWGIVDYRAAPPSRLTPRHLPLHRGGKKRRAVGDAGPYRRGQEADAVIVSPSVMTFGHDTSLVRGRRRADRDAATYGQGVTDSHASDIGHWLGMTGQGTDAPLGGGAHWPRPTEASTASTVGRDPRVPPHKILRLPTKEVLTKDTT